MAQVKGAGRTPGENQIVEGYFLECNRNNYKGRTWKSFVCVLNDCKIVVRSE
jgi:hypothetical protein